MESALKLQEVDGEVRQSISRQPLRERQQQQQLQQSVRMPVQHSSSVRMPMQNSRSVQMQHSRSVQM